MGIVLLLGLGVCVAVLAGLILRRLGQSEWWGLFVPAIAALILWIAGSVWIFSSVCGDVQTCDSGGWLAFSAEVVVASLLVTLGAGIGCLAIRLKPK